MSQQADLREAIAVLSAHRDRFGEATIDTVVNVLTGRLAALSEAPPAEESTRAVPQEQRKQVTVLFATIDGVTRLAGASHNTTRLQQIDVLWQQLDAAIRNHGGVVDKHMGDVVMGIFGASVSHENDPEQAVRCALALRELVSEYPSAAGQRESAAPVIRIGINTGQASIGQVGTDEWSTAVGDAVNVASGLKDAIPEAGIYISQDTCQLVRRLFRFDSLGEFPIKGRKSPVAIYRVLAPRLPILFHGVEGIEGVRVPMIGREAEIASLQKAFRRVALTGRGELVTIMGDAGVGKSRLAREFHTWLESAPIRAMIFQGRSDQRLLNVSYGLFHELLVTHFAIEENDSARMVESKLLKGLANYLSDGRVSETPALRERARLIARLGGLKTPDRLGQDTARRKPTVGPDQMHEVVVDYFVAVAQRSGISLLFFEDIHWADEDSLVLLERLARAAADSPMLIVCLARPSLLERRPDWDQETGSRILPLSPLSEVESKRLVFNILRKLPQIPPALSDLIVRSAGGNPFYVEEIVRVLIEDGVILPDDSSWRLRARELTRLRVPTTLTGVLQARLDRLPELERVALQQAAIIGDEFWDSAVQQLSRASRYAFDQEQVAVALRSLEQRDMIFRAPLSDFSGSRAYLFRHSMLREVAYESVLLRDRPGYHLQAARWLESQSNNLTVDYSATIAQHHELAGQLAEAARLYELAAQRATEQHKLGSAIEHYRKVLDLLRYRPHDLDTYLNVYWQLGRVLQVQARLVEALEVYLTMRDAAQREGNLAGQARAENAMASVYLGQGNADQALAAASRAEELARLAGEPMELTWALLRGGAAAGGLGRADEAVEKANQAVESARLLAAPQETARALALLAGSLAKSDDLTAAGQTERDLAGLAAELEVMGEETDSAFALARLGELYLSHGEFDRSRASLRRAIELAGAENRAEAAEAQRLLGLAVCRAGNAREGIGYLEEAATLAEALGNRYLWLGCRLGLGEALLAQAQYPAAEATLRQVIAAAEDGQRLGDWVELPRAYDLLVEALIQEGRGEEVSRIVKHRRRDEG